MLTPAPNASGSGLSKTNDERQVQHASSQKLYPRASASAPSIHQGRSGTTTSAHLSSARLQNDHTHAKASKAVQADDSDRMESGKPAKPRKLAVEREALEKVLSGYEDMTPMKPKREATKAPAESKTLK